MTQTFSLNTTLIQQWVKEKTSATEIQHQLRSLPPEVITAYEEAHKKAVYAKKQMRGFICMAVGAFLGFISCVFTMINPVPALYDLVLYGVTSVAVAIVFVGLYYVVEG